MKANELMIGDWVLSGGKSMKVICLTDKINMIDDNKTKWFAEEVHPIPFTAEILEKNGFQHHLIAENGFKREEWTLSDDYYDIVVSEWSDSIWVFRYDCTEMNTPHEQRTMGYLHQLQHALRDNDIDKEIVL